MDAMNAKTAWIKEDRELLADSQEFFQDRNNRRNDED